MHELSIVHDIIDSLEHSLTGSPGARIISVELSVGTHSGVDPEALQFVFPLATENTCAACAQLRIETVPLRVDCPTCGDKQLLATSRSCPRCGSTDVRIVAGSELIIQAIELAMPESAQPLL
jgi:hydrogenase nickel incorporation protein HypA/HybF